MFYNAGLVFNYGKYVKGDGPVAPHGQLVVDQHFQRHKVGLVGTIGLPF